MRVLVTGASGFVGRLAIKGLVRRGAEVHALARRRPVLPEPHIWHEADLLDGQTARDIVVRTQPQAILHLAWIAEHGAFWTAAENLDWIGATLALARAASEAGTRRFIAAGTCYEYDWPPDGACHEFNTPLVPATLYGICKDATRRVLEASISGRGVEFVWARLFSLYGPGEDPRRLVPSLSCALLAGKPAQCASGRPVRDFMDVRDAGDALAAIVLSEVTGPVNVASGQGTSIADVAVKLGVLSGRSDLVQIGALLERPDEPPRIVADVTRLKTEVGVLPARGLDEGLRDALSFWAGQNCAAAE